MTNLRAFLLPEPRRGGVIEFERLAGLQTQRPKFFKNQRRDEMTGVDVPGGMSARLTTYLVAGWSGFFVMSVELLSSRILAPYYGSSIFVWGGILTVFMTFLSFGYLLGGMLSTQNPRLWKLGLLLAAEALLTLPVISADPVLEQLSLVIPDPRYGSLIGSLMLFAIPTTLTGMISPYAIRLLVKGIGSSGREAGLVYFVSTIGSAAGTITTGFYLVLYFDIYQIISFLVLISIFISTIAALISYRLKSHHEN